MKPRSVRVEIVAGFAMMLLALVVVGGYALVRQTRAVALIRLQNTGYLPLSLTLVEARAGQSTLGTLLERVVGEQDRAVSRTWITAFRAGRRQQVAQARLVVQSAAAGARSREDAELLAGAARSLENVERVYREDERDFAALFDALSANDVARASVVQARLRPRERAAHDELIRVTASVGRRMVDLAAEADAAERATLRVLAFVTLLAMAAGLATLLSAHRALKPLALLINRVRSVAAGDLSPKVVPARPDEIGELAGEFENMVQAVRHRDTALREKADAILRAEQHLQRVVGTLRSAVMVVGPDGEVQSANAAAEKMAGGQSLAPAAFGGTPFGAVEAVRRAVDELRAGRGGGASLLAVAMGERTLDVAVVPFEAPAGQGGFALVVADDVTEREQARARLLQNERLAAIGRMAAHVTHEVRNPLSSMALNAEMLADEARGIGPAGREMERLVGAIQREIDRLTGVTEEYLRVARLPRPRLEREDVLALVEETVQFVAPEFARAGVQVSVRAHGEIPAAMLDEAQIRQSLLNLLRNAREVLETVSDRPRTVRVSLSAERGGVRIAVSDSGPGVPEQVRPKLFELFFTTKERGSGLGLPLTREIVLAHGGSIEVERASEEEGGGARFVIWLPAAPPRPGDGDVDGDGDGDGSDGGA